LLKTFCNSHALKCFVIKKKNNARNFSTKCKMTNIRNGELIVSKKNNKMYLNPLDIQHKRSAE